MRPAACAAHCTRGAARERGVPHLVSGTPLAKRTVPMGARIGQRTVADHRDPGRVPAASNGVDADALRARFNLTRSEAAVAALLADACTVVEIAQRLHVSVFTVRSHLRRIYAKTGVNRQAALVHRLLTAAR